MAGFDYLRGLSKPCMILSGVGNQGQKKSVVLTWFSPQKESRNG